MKIRSGFVSNSSSSSFCILGIKLQSDRHIINIAKHIRDNNLMDFDWKSYEDIPNKLTETKSLLEEADNKFNEYINSYEYSEEVFDSLECIELSCKTDALRELYRRLENRYKNFAKDVVNAYIGSIDIENYGDVYIGKSISKMEPDQTMGEFRKEVAARLKFVEPEKLEILFGEVNR